MIKIHEEGSVHPEIQDEGGWAMDDPLDMVGGNITLENGQIVDSLWRDASGLYGNNGWLAAEAEAATALIRSIQNGQIARIVLGVLGGSRVVIDSSGDSDDNL